MSHRLAFDKLRLFALAATLLQLLLIACVLIYSLQQSNEISLLKSVVALDRVLIESGVTAESIPLHIDDKLFAIRARNILKRNFSGTSDEASKAESLTTSLVSACQEMQNMIAPASFKSENLISLRNAFNHYIDKSRQLLLAKENTMNFLIPMVSILSLLIVGLTVVSTEQSIRQQGSQPSGNGDGADSDKTAEESAVSPSALAKLSNLDQLAMNLTGTLTIGTKSAKSYLDNMPVGLLSANSDGIVQAANFTALKMLRCTIDKVVGSNIASFFRLHDGKRVDVDTLREHGLDKVVEALLACRDAASTRTPVDISFAQFSGPTGTGLIVNIVDVSDRYEVEKLKQDFLSMVSHDLRTPLTSIGLALSSIASAGSNPLSNEQVELANGAEREVARLVRLVSTLLDFARIRSGKLELHKRAFDVQPLLERLSSNMSRLATSRSIVIVTKSNSDYVVADEDRIYQVLENFLANAIKFSPDGGKIVIEALSAGGGVRFEVRDSGVGISEDKREVIFERFEQVSEEDHTVRGGTGLGLAICKLMVEQHGGTIGVTSEVGKGSCFWFTLPD